MDPKRLSRPGYHLDLLQNAHERASTLWTVSGGFRCLKPPRGALLTEVANFINAQRSSLLISATTCTATCCICNLLVLTKVQRYSPQCPAALCSPQQQPATCPAAATSVAPDRDRVLLLSICNSSSNPLMHNLLCTLKAHPPEEPDGLAVCAVAATVRGVALHIRRIHPSALAAGQQLVDLLWVEKAQPCAGDDLRQVRARLTGCPLWNDPESSSNQPFDMMPSSQTLGCLSVGHPKTSARTLPKDLDCLA
jgi:hypothetical protein